MNANQHRAFIVKAVRTRLEKHHNIRNKCVGGQSDLGSSDDEDNHRDSTSDMRIKDKTTIANIINKKSKSIAQSLMKDGLQQFY